MGEPQEQPRQLPGIFPQLAHIELVEGEMAAARVEDQVGAAFGETNNDRSLKPSERN